MCCEMPGMCGDVNLYLNDLDDPQTAEIEVGVLSQTHLHWNCISAAAEYLH